MNEQSYFHWDLFRPPIHSPSFAMGPSFFDIREEAMRGMPNKTKAFAFDQSCALWSKDIGLDPSEGLQNVGGRVLEIRKEKSRDAARSRRGKENYEFYELAKLLPLPAAITSQLDKASIIRLSISYLKLRDFCGHGDPPWARDSNAAVKALKGGQRRRNGAGMAIELFELHQGAHILQSLDGFAFALSNDGRFLYISETVSIYLGLSQVEMAGSSIFDYVHTQDHQELADQLGLALAGISSTMSSPPSPTTESSSTQRSITPTLPDRVPVMTPNFEKGPDRTFCIRMKSTLTKRGVHTRSSGYRVVLMIGQFRNQMQFGLGRKSTPTLLGLTGVAIALPPPTITELRLEADTFIMRLTTELKVIYCENMISNLTDWKCEELSGRDLYKFCHPGDIQHLRKLHTDLLMKGQVLSPSMRMLNKGGGYIWVQVCATSLYNSKTSDDQTILAIFQTISSIEHRDVVMDAGQLGDTIIPTSAQDTGSAPLLMEPDPAPSLSPPENRLPVPPIPPAHTNIESMDSQPDTPCLFPDNVDNDFLLEDRTDDLTKLDSKTSRRKGDRPRKRKRESHNEIVSVTNLDSDRPESQHIDVESTETDILNLSASKTNGSNSPGANDRISHVTSPQLPEDLSFRAIVDNKADAPNCDGNKNTDTMANSNNLMANSVKELEKAMNRHLPSRSDTFHQLVGQDGSRDHCVSQKPVSHWSTSSTMSLSDDSLAASAFLRHLYTNRDTVIRSNGRPNCVNGDVNALTMLTPPNTDSCKDQLHLNIPHISVQSKSQTSIFKDAVSSSDDFGMTPPSSVSPQDKVTPSFPETETDCLSMRFAAHGNQIHPQPMKIQTFPSILEPDTDLSKSHFSPMPSYTYHGADINHFTHCTVPGGGAVFEPRPQPGHGMWFGPSYTS